MTKRRLGALLCVVAFVLTLASAAWQRTTGPSAPRRGRMEVSGASHRYRLPRTAITGEDLRVAIPDPGAGATGEMRYRRWPTDDPLTAVPLVREEGVLAAMLPTQPAAGKLEYHLVLAAGGGEVRVPADPARDPVVRFRGSVSAAILIPHIALMFFAVFFGLLAGLDAMFRPGSMQKTAWMALGTMTVGGLVLGPLVQKAAFGAYWTGFPFGHDLTDNKVLIMWFVWIGAVLVLRFVSGRRAGLRRGAVLAASILMFGVYLIPHSTWGSQLDWQKHGAPPAGAAAEPGAAKRVPGYTREDRPKESAMRGVQFLVNDDGEKTAVLIDLRKNAQLWEDFYDVAVARSRANEPRESLDSVRRSLRRSRPR